MKSVARRLRRSSGVRFNLRQRMIGHHDLFTSFFIEYFLPANIKTQLDMIRARKINFNRRAHATRSMFKTY